MRAALSEPKHAASGARRPRRFAMSFAAALALNALVIALVAAAAPRWHLPPERAPQAAWVRLIPANQDTHARASAESSLQAESHLRSAAAGATQRTVAGALKPRVLHHPFEGASRPATVVAAPPVPAAAPGLQTAEGTVRFYEFREVDRTAEPDSDWNLDPAILDTAGVQKLVFEVFVDPTGAIVSCTILEPADLASETRELLQTRLSRTKLSPATREGMAVASVRRIELSVE